MITWPCPVCGERLQVSERHTGTRFVCPLCGSESKIPRDLTAAREKAAAQRREEAAARAEPRAPQPVRVPDPGVEQVTRARVQELLALQGQRALSSEELRELAGHAAALGDDDGAARARVALSARGVPTPAQPASPPGDAELDALLGRLRREQVSLPKISQPELSGTRVLGGLLLVVGVLMVWYFFFAFDPSVEVPRSTFMGESIGGGRVNNLGLMQDRQNGIIIGCVMSLAGLVVSMFGGRRG